MRGVTANLLRRGLCIMVAVGMVVLPPSGPVASQSAVIHPPLRAAESTYSRVATLAAEGKVEFIGHTCQGIEDLGALFPSQTLSSFQAPYTTGVFSDTLTADGRLQPVVLPEMPEALRRASLGLAQTRVTVYVRDQSGSAVRDACVYAVSADWGVVMPNRWPGACGSSSGIVSIDLPEGRWSFFAVAPGYFVSLAAQPIAGMTITLTLRATTAMNLEVRDFDGRLMSDVEVYGVDPDKKPTLPAMYVGKTAGGMLRIATTAGAKVDVLLVRQPVAGTSDGTAFFVYAGMVNAGGTLRYRFTRDQLARIRFNLTSPSGSPGPHSCLVVQYKTLSWDYWPWFCRGWGSWWNELQLWVSPSPIEIIAEEFANEWSFGFAPVVIEPRAGSTYEMQFGGPLQIRTWFYPLLDNGRQVFVQVQDGAAHQLVYVSQPGGSFASPITLRDEEGNIVYEGSLDHSNLTGFLQVEPAGKRYEIYLDLGFFGSYILSGVALDEASTWRLETLETPHFRIFWPRSLHDQSAAIAAFAERSYQATASQVGHETTSFHSHGKIEVHFPFYCNCAGWAGGSTMAVMVEYLSYGGLLAPWKRGVVEGIWSHELAHVFQFTGTGLGGYYITGWFGEPFASFVGGLALEEIFGGNVGLDWLARDLEGFFWNLSKDADMMGSSCYVINAVRRFYTMSAHQGWIRFWAGPDFPNRRCVSPLGLPVESEIAVAYSHVVQENLGWLFRESRQDISDATIAAGLEAINVCHRPAFTDVTVLARARSQGGFHGAAWGDYDRDGDLDIYATSFNAMDVLFRNDGDGTFTNVTDTAGLGNPGHARSAIWGDYNNDGWLDLYVTREAAGLSAQLWRNNADGTFTDVTPTAGVGTTSGMSAAWGDYDGDGLLDILVARWCDTPRLYRNQGNGTFMDVAWSAGLLRGGCGVGAMFGDYDLDGDLDVFYSLGWSLNALYRNDGNGTFTDVTVASGLVGNMQGGAAAWGDYDNDGDLDLLQSGDQVRCWLYRNNGDGTFTEVGESAGIEGDLIGRGVAWADYDNDGWLDFAWLGWDGLRLFRNNQNGTFSDVTDLEGLDRHWGGNGLAWGDYDGDGDVDLYVTGWEGNALYRNSSGGNWLTVDLVGRRSNKAGVGARVIVASPTGIQVREVSGGSGYHGQDSLPVEFGLGSVTDPLTVIIRWPSGLTQELRNVGVNQHLSIVEGWYTVGLPVIMRSLRR